MINFKSIFESGLPLTPMYLVQSLKSLFNKIFIEKSKLEDIMLMQTGSDITSVISVAELVEIARCIKTRGSVLIEDDTDATLSGGICTPLETWTLFNEDRDVSIAIAWINRSGSSVIYKRLEMYVNYSTNKVILSSADYKSL
jgi:hypothetical protein